VHAAVSGTVRTANAPVTLPVERVPAPSEPPVTTASTAPPATSVLAPAPSASAAPVLVASSRALSSADRPGHDLDLARERAALEVARTAIGRGQSASALQALAQHAREFPRGQLGEEREALWIQALLGSGQAAEARARAARFRARYPKSMMIPVLDALLEKSD
jgi:TolA-binding protein